MKLDDLLKLPVFDGTAIVAGAKGVNREVYTVNMMDAPDIIPYLKRNELLVTTAFHFKDDLPALLELIRQMSRQDCAALGIKANGSLAVFPSRRSGLRTSWDCR